MQHVRIKAEFVFPHQFTQAPGKTASETTTLLTTLLNGEEITIVEADPTSKSVSDAVVVSLSVKGVNVLLTMLQQGLCLDLGKSV